MRTILQRGVVLSFFLWLELQLFVSSALAFAVLPALSYCFSSSSTFTRATTTTRSSSSSSSRRRRRRRTFSSGRLFQSPVVCSNNDGNNNKNDAEGWWLIGLLQRHHCPRLQTIRRLPVTVEVQVQGETIVGQMIHVDAARQKVTVQTTTTAATSTAAFQQQQQQQQQQDDGESRTIPTTTASTIASTMVVDFGQITTVWVEDQDTSSIFDMNNSQDVSTVGSTPATSTSRSTTGRTSGRHNNNNPNNNHPNNAATVESILDSLYRNCLVQQRQQTSTTQTLLTKKQIAALLQDGNNNNNNNPEQQQQQQPTVTTSTAAATILRHLVKAGGWRCERVVDSQRFCCDQVGGSSFRREEAATILANDATGNGRFKRWPSQWILASSNNEDDEDDSDGPPHPILTFLNGGWLAVDPSVRAGTEARQLVQRRSNSTATTKTKQQQSLSVSDQRILRRLECLAMGELLYDNNNNNNNQPNILELDVRETLHHLALSRDPRGAQQALVQLGYWSDTTPARFQQVLQPWSSTVLEAARWYAEEYIHNNNNKDSYNNDPRVVDLRHLPCLSVDAAKATFRDDALGIRSRQSTGRPVIPEASQWEILVHIADVSDLYSVTARTTTATSEKLLPQESTERLAILAQAAARRGASRYDLPLGPLHLLPPVALRALAFSPERSSPQRCVTLWAYIDERNGKLLEAGFERTLVAPPQTLSFAQATALLSSSSETVQSESDDRKTRALLSVLERNLQRWSEHRRRSSDTARQREWRLSQRAAAAAASPTRDDGHDGFVRSRGHGLVDAALDLYGHAATRLLQSHPLPRAAGTAQGGRVATAPLRRYVDGQAQRQILAVLCGYGKPLRRPECVAIGQTATEARNAITNIRATKRKGGKREVASNDKY